MKKQLLLLSLVAFLVFGCYNRANTNVESKSSDTEKQERPIDIDSILEKVDSETAAIKEKESTKVEYDAIVGSYRCKKTKDAYVFYSDGSGQFFTSGTCTDFTWKRSDGNVTIKYKEYGTQKLKFDQKAKTITEVSESLGVLIFNEE